MDLLRTEGGCQRICELPEDLLLRILLLLPTKDAVATGILSKRWRCVWKMLHELAFKDDGQGSESFGWFVEKSLQHHKAPELVSLVVELGPQCPVDVDVRKWVDKAVNHGVKKLDFNLLWTTSLPESLYTCDSLVSLISNQILDVSFPPSLPSLSYLKLAYVVYKDEESLARLLSSSPVLKELVVRRPGKDDNLTNFTVKVPSLKSLTYVTSEEEEEEEEEEEYLTGSLVIDCPGLNS
ncbi:PREDICTED: putative F-box/FBD/LRR-repeat protein At1g22000 [Camelina sativa]|uniref:F-box/FBD/LRR-repeat protein At1g22000 n=1 Tax=Camelina sativa TaxID=90675 RepID=A0ABM0YXU8_CAMSA|nr:PREDICTED: putative F-box/FBD/LRR-repeat protein At1g22000 [Camelina sativa]